MTQSMSLTDVVFLDLVFEHETFGAKQIISVSERSLVNGCCHCPSRRAENVNDGASIVSLCKA